MNRTTLSLAVAASCAIGLVARADVDGAKADARGNLRPFANPSGYAATYSTAGFIDTANPFFQSLGSNGRSCESCHQQAEGWTVTPEGVRRRFRASAGTDPIFRLFAH